jgi:hypothetical protein
VGAAAAAAGYSVGCGTSPAAFHMLSSVTVAQLLLLLL